LDFLKKTFKQYTAINWLLWKIRRLFSLLSRLIITTTQDQAVFESQD